VESKDDRVNFYTAMYHTLLFRGSSRSMAVTTARSTTRFTTASLTTTILSGTHSEAEHPC
jgi:hypothetical protein